MATFQKPPLGWRNDTSGPWTRSRTGLNRLVIEIAQSGTLDGISTFLR